MVIDSDDYVNYGQAIVGDNANFQTTLILNFDLKKGNSTDGYNKKLLMVSKLSLR